MVWYTCSASPHHAVSGATSWRAQQLKGVYQYKGLTKSILGSLYTVASVVRARYYLNCLGTYLQCDKNFMECTIVTNKWYQTLENERKWKKSNLEVFECLSNALGNVFWLFLTYVPTYLVLLYNVPFLGQFWTPLHTLKRDVINGRSLSLNLYRNVFLIKKKWTYKCA